MQSNESKLIIPNAEELSLHLPKEVELEKASEVDFKLEETFPSPEALNGKGAVTVLYLVNIYLSQMSKVWKSRARLMNNRMIGLEREVKLLRREIKNARVSGRGF